MSTLGRVSLQDCSVDLIIPSLAAFSPATPSASSKSERDEQSLEDLTLQAAESDERELTEAYVGETIFLVVTITGPDSANYTCETMFQALETFGDVNIFMGHIPPNESSSSALPSSRSRQKAITSRSCSLPILRESAWIGSDRSTVTTQIPLSSPREPPKVNPSAPKVLCKGMWVLVRSPPETSELADIMSVAGKQDIFISLRERSVSHNLRNSPVWASIDRASRLFGKSLALSASKPLMVNIPLEISCHQVAAGGCSGKTFISITARNSTSDAQLFVVPPYIHVSASKIVDDPAVGRRKSAADKQVTSDRKTMDGVTSDMALDDAYEFVPIFSLQDEDEAEVIDFDSESTRKLLREQSANIVSNNDYGLFIPSFNYWLKKAVPLGPREIFNFVYAIVEKGNSQFNDIDNDISRAADNDMDKAEASATVNVNTASNTGPRLKPGQCLETSVAVAWNCSPRDASEAAKDLLDGREPLHREMSSGGVLATGKRGNVAIQLTSVHWTPPALIAGIVVNFAGPSVATVGSEIQVSISILNQSEDDLHAASLLVQHDEDKHEGNGNLLALRTVICIGQIMAGSGTTLQLPCVALKTGTVSLGRVSVVDEPVGISRKVWAADSTFEVFVLDPNRRIPGDPALPDTALGTEDSGDLEEQ